MLTALKKIYWELKNELAVLIAIPFIFLIYSLLQDILYVNLSESFFSNKILILNYLTETKSLLLISIVLTLFYILIKYYNKEIQAPNYIKIIIGVCAFTLTWTFSLNEFNYYFNQWYFIDRLILVLLCLLSIRYPFITIFFVIQTICISKQFTFPKVLIYTYTDKKIIFDILILYWLFYVFKVFIKKLNWNLFIIITLAVVGNWYILAGLGKLRIDWLQENLTFNLYSSVQVFGWLQFLPDYINNYLGSIIMTNNNLIQISVITIEVLLPIIILTHRRLVIPTLAFYIVFHLMIFFLSGIFFWKWILLEISLILIIKHYQLNLSKTKYLMLYIPVLFFGSIFLKNINLSWLDSGYVHHYKFHIQTDSNEIIPLDASFFSPYDVIFAQNRFHYLFNNKTISSTFGSSQNKNLTRYFNEFEEKDFDENEIIKLKNKYGVSNYDMNKKLKLESFLIKFVNIKLQNDVKWINYLDAPMHIWQGENQQNLRIINPKKILISSDEVIANSQNHFKVFTSDTLCINLN